MIIQRGEPAEVLLRGNVRPVVGLAVVVATVFAAVVVATRSTDARQSLRGPVAAGAVLAAVAVGMLAVAAARPRLRCSGDALLVHLSPTRVERLPLDVAECFFPGSNPLTRGGEQTCEHHAAFRVNTLVLRLAERADDYRARPTFTPWGTWGDSYVVFDGRWCEPLSPDLARRLGHRLVEAKRAAATTGARS